jgi:hypothetical protein
MIAGNACPPLAICAIHGCFDKNVSKPTGVSSAASAASSHSPRFLIQNHGFLEGMKSYSNRRWADRQVLSQKPATTG